MCPLLKRRVLLYVVFPSTRDVYHFRGPPEEGQILGQPFNIKFPRTD